VAVSPWIEACRREAPEQHHHDKVKSETLILVSEA
jgi:hypothetical protein